MYIRSREIHQTYGELQAVIPFVNPLMNKSDVMTRDRRLTVIVFSLFFSWLLAVPFEGQVLYQIAEYYGGSAYSFVFWSMAAHFVGLIACGFVVKNMFAAKRLILFSIAFCAAATGVFFFPPSLIWTVALLSASFLVGACVAAWGFYFKGFTAKGSRIRTIADCLIFSNILMIFLNMTAIHISPQIGLGFSILMLILSFVAATRLPKAETPGGLENQTVVKPNAVKAGIAGSLAFLCLFIVVITINSGLMYRVVNPAFAHLEWLTSWYWSVPYIAALIIMRNLSGKFNRSYLLYVAIAMIGGSFILFILLGNAWPDYLLINTLMLGAFGVYDLFWWSILGDMLAGDKNPAKIIGIGLAANVLGVLFGEIIGNVISTEQNHIYIAFGVVCATLIMLPPLSSRLTRLLKSHAYLPALAEVSDAEQTRIITELILTEPLTMREKDVMSLLVQGKAYKTIATELHISENTIGTHARNIYSKAGVTNRIELMALLSKPSDTPSE